MRFSNTTTVMNGNWVFGDLMKFYQRDYPAWSISCHVVYKWKFSEGAESYKL